MAVVASGVAAGAVFLWACGVLLLWGSQNRRPGIAALLAAGVALFAADQAAKLAVLRLLAPSGQLSLAGGWLAVCYAPNYSNSVFFALLGVQLPARWMDVTLKVAMFSVFMLLLFWYLPREGYKMGTGRMRFSIMLLAAGAASSVLDTILYGYVLDYISLAGLVAFDLKDLYLQFGIALFIIDLVAQERARKKQTPQA